MDSDVIGFVVLLLTGALVVAPVWILALLYYIKGRVDRAPRRAEWDQLVSEVRQLRMGASSHRAGGEPAATAAKAPEPVPPPPVPPQPVHAKPASPVYAASSEERVRAITMRSVHDETPPPRASVPRPAVTPAPTAAPESRVPGVFETAAREGLRKAWNWFVVGEEFRRKDVPAEFAIATNWLMRGGILLLVLGVGFFLNYTISKGLLGPHGRVALSVLAGTGLIAGGLRLFGKPYHLLGQGLVGGGLAMLYFSIYSSAVLFELIPLPPAFLLMALVTAAAGVLAVRHDSLLVAVLGLIGGYATPLMLSTGTESFPVLFSYLTLLGIGLLGIAWRKHWPVLTYLSLLFTHILAISAVATHYEAADLAVVLPFLCLFFALFSTAIFLYNLTHRTRTTIIELLGLFLNSAAFFGLGYHVIVQAHPRAAAAWLAVGLALYYTIHVVALLRRGMRDRALLTAFVALAASFLVIALPLLLTGSWLTASWSVQAVALLWIALRLGSPTLRRIAEGLLCLVLVRLVFLDFGHGFRGAPPVLWTDYLPLLGDRLVQFGLPILSFGAVRRLLARAPAPDASATVPGAPGSRRLLFESRFALSFYLVILFFYLTLEAHDLFAVLYAPFQVPAVTLVWAGFGLYLLLCRKRMHPGLLAGFFVTALGVLIVKALTDLTAWEPDLSILAYRAAERTVLRALVRLVDMAALLGFFYAGWALLRREASNRMQGIVSGWVALALGLAYLTMETGTVLTQFVPEFRGGGVSLLWGLYALGLVAAGIRHASRSLRMVGLALFSITLAKIFLSDLAHLGQVYRFIAFIALGIVLLFAAFIYLKHRNRFETTPPEEPTP